MRWMWMTSSGDYYLVIAVLGTMGESTALKMTDPVSYANSRRKNLVAIFSDSDNVEVLWPSRYNIFFNFFGNKAI